MNKIISITVDTKMKYGNNESPWRYLHIRSNVTYQLLNVPANLETVLINIGSDHQLEPFISQITLKLIIIYVYVLS